MPNHILYNNPIRPFAQGDIPHFAEFWLRFFLFRRMEGFCDGKVFPPKSSVEEFSLCFHAFRSVSIRRDSPPRQPSTFSARPRSSWEIARRVVRYLLPYKWMAAGTIGCAVISLAFTFVYPSLTPYIIDEVIGQGKLEELSWIIFVLIGAFFLRESFNSLRILINNHFEQNVIYDMRVEVYGRLQELPVRYFDQRASGDLMTRVIEDVNAVERVLIDGTEQGVIAVLSVLGVLGILLFKNTILALVTLVSFPLLIGGVLAYTLTAHRRYRKQREAASAMNALLMDNLQGVRQIKAFGRHKHENHRFAARAEGLKTRHPRRHESLGIVFSLYGLRQLPWHRARALGWRSASHRRVHDRRRAYGLRLLPRLPLRTGLQTSRTQPNDAGRSCLRRTRL